MIKLPPILPAPPCPMTLPSSAKWLAGEGAGSWFVIEKDAMSNYRISRYSPEGNLECEGLFATDQQINLEEDYSISYPSHCTSVTLEQAGELIRFEVEHH